MMTGSNALRIGVASDETTRQWRKRGARLDANLQRNMRWVTSIVAIGLTIGVTVVWLLR
jgi:hypothetical protein